MKKLGLIITILIFASNLYTANQGDISGKWFYNDRNLKVELFIEENNKFEAIFKFRSNKTIIYRGEYQLRGTSIVFNAHTIMRPNGRTIRRNFSLFFDIIKLTDSTLILKDKRNRSTYSLTR